MADAPASSRRPQLPTAVQLHILALLPPNERALSGRFACRDLADTLTGAANVTAFLALPLPPHAAPWAQEAGLQHMRQLPFRHKLQLLSTAAASGREVNLEVAWAVLQPSILPEELHVQPWSKLHDRRYPDPCQAAVQAGHPQLLAWLIRHCPALMRPEQVLVTAARHCDLAGLQATWRVVEGHVDRHDRPSVIFDVMMNATAESHTPDAVGKMQWVQSAGRARRDLDIDTAEAAARSGDLSRLQWLRARGCPMRDFWQSVLATALEHADLAVARWLVDEARCRLPGVGGYWENLVSAAAASPDGAAKLQWLVEHGAPLLDPKSGIFLGVAYQVVEAGRVETLQYLQSLAGPGSDPKCQARLQNALAKRLGAQLWRRTCVRWAACFQLGITARLVMCPT